jgi:hypothetical protein
LRALERKDRGGSAVAYVRARWRVLPLSSMPAMMVRCDWLVRSELLANHEFVSVFG